MRKYDYFWRSNPDWYHYEKFHIAVVNVDAPPEAQESYKHYLEQRKRAQERIDEGKSMD